MTIQSTASGTGWQGFIGRSEGMLALFERISLAAASEACVFITGETGTGKELCARTVHDLGRRPDGPFIAVNCAAIPRELAESEFFGHVRGAFTGAGEDRRGLVEQANGGTLFLDEICEMDLALQGKLLRLVETGVMRPVGSARERQVDVRIVCATNRDPQREVREGRFRADLFWRLHVLPVTTPPLRERGEDIILLAQHFLDCFASEENRPRKAITQEAAQRLMAHDWPGNVRELQNHMRQVVVFYEGDELTVDMLDALLPVAAASDGGLKCMERLAIEAAIESCEGSVPRAARLLGVSPSTIYRKRQGWQRREAS